MTVCLTTCHYAIKQPLIPAPERIYSTAIQAVGYQLQRFAVDSDGQAYGVSGNTLYAINSLIDEIEKLYKFDSAIVGFHITNNNSFIISTDNNHWSESAPCRVYESIDVGRSFIQIKTIIGGCALWLSIDSDKAGNLYLGEYGPKEPGASKNVWKRDGQTDQWKIVFQAPLKSDSHIHRVAVDPDNQNLWVTVGDTRKNRGVYLSINQGESWSHKLDSQATAVAFTQNKIYWGEDRIDYGGIVVTDKQGLDMSEIFNANHHGNYVGSVYELLALPDGTILAPIMKYADRDNVASLWYGKDDNWKLLMIFESLSGQGKDVSSIAGPDKNGFVLLTGYKLKVSRLPKLN